MVRIPLDVFKSTYQENTKSNNKGLFATKLETLSGIEEALTILFAGWTNNDSSNASDSILYKEGDNGSSSTTNRISQIMDVPPPPPPLEGLSLPPPDVPSILGN